MKKRNENEKTQNDKNNAFHTQNQSVGKISSMTNM